MEDFEQSIVAILNKEYDNFSDMARRGYRTQGRGAIFIWESEGKGVFSTFRASFLPLNDRAFRESGPDPKKMVGQYDPDTEFVAVFITADEMVHTVRIEIAPERPLTMEV